MNYENLYGWFPQETVPFYTLRDKNETLVVMKVPYDEDFDFIYCQRNYGTDPLSRNTAFIYSGIYNRLDNKLYDMQYPLRGVFPQMDSKMSFTELTDKIEADVRQYVADYVDIESDNLMDAGFKDPVSGARFEEYQEVDADKSARRMFLSGQTSDDVEYTCGFTLDKASTKLVLDYLRTPKAVVEGLGNEYMSSCSDDIVFDLLSNELLKEYLRDFEEAEDSPLLRQKAIIDAVNKSGAQTLSVTVQRDDIALTFKYPARYFKMTSMQSYSAWDIPSKERHDFYEAFNNSHGFSPEEITDISFRGKSIYSADPYIPIDSESEGFNISM